MVLGLLSPVIGGLAISTVRGAMSGAKSALASSPADRAAVAANLGKLPLRFEANVGQANRQARFIARASGGTVFLTDREAVLSFAASEAAKGKPTASGAAVVRMRPLNANAPREPEGIDLLPGVTNYLTGNDPTGWRTGVASYGGVRYRSVYPGIDQVFHGRQGGLEYDFEVAPGADPSTIALGFEGATGMSVDLAGDLVMSTPAGEIRHERPVVYQQVGGARRPVEGSYELQDERVGFSIGAYDTTLPLVIDPLIASSAFLGGVGDDSGNDITVDATGATYITGSAASLDFPTTAGAYDRECGVSKCETDLVLYNGVTTAGSNLFTITGTFNEYVPYFDASDVGRTITSPNLPAGTTVVSALTGDKAIVSSNATASGTAVPFTLRGKVPPKSDAFVAKLNPAGTALVYATYLGGVQPDWGTGITLDGSAPWVVGTTGSGDFPTTDDALDRVCGSGVDVAGGVDTSCNGNEVFNTGSFTAGSNVITVPEYTLSGLWGDYPDPAGIHVGRTIISPHLPPGTKILYSTSPTTTVLSANALDTATNASFAVAYSLSPFDVGKTDSWAAKLSPDGASLLYSTYLGGQDIDTGARIARDHAGGDPSTVAIVGTTRSRDFPVSSDAYDRRCGGGLDPGETEDGSCDADVHFTDGSTTLGSNVLTSAGAGFGDGDVGRLVSSAMFPSGARIVSVTGPTEVTLSAAATVTGTGVTFAVERNGPKTDAFVVRLDADTGGLGSSSYFGGNQDDTGSDVAFDPAVNYNFPQDVFVTGASGGGTFPTTAGVLQRTCGAGTAGPTCVNGDAFVAKFFTWRGGSDSLVYSTLLGGNQTDAATALAVDVGGNAYLTGSTGSVNFPTKDAYQGSRGRTPNPYQPDTGGQDAFVAKLGVDGSALGFSTFLGGEATESGVDVAIDSSGNPYVYGTVHNDGSGGQGGTGMDFPTVDPFQVANGSGRNLFLTKFTSSGRNVVYSTYLGASVGGATAGGLAVDAGGVVYVTGGGGPDFSSVPGSFRAGPQGGKDAFVLRIVPGQPPYLTATSPAGGLDAGGTTVELHGVHLGDVTGVQFGSAPAAFTIISDTEIRAVSPPRPPGVAPATVVSITVTSPRATSATGGAGQFRYGEGERTGPCGNACSGLLVTLLDGRVLATNANESRLFDGKTRTWAVTGSCDGCSGTNRRAKATATLLPNGKVLWAGGQDDPSGSFLYDPVAGTWSRTRDASGTVTTMTTERVSHAAVLLPNGTVLVTGGNSEPVAEVFNPATGTWTKTIGDMTSVRSGHTATLLDPALGGCAPSCGKVLLAFGHDSPWSTALTTSELYDPATGQFTAAGESLGSGRTGHAAVQLADGRAMVVGGTAAAFFGQLLNSAELFNPADGSWSLTGIVPRAVPYTVALRLPNGTVLANGSGTDTSEQMPAEGFLWAPSTGRWSRGPILPNIAMALVPTGPFSACGSACGAVVAADHTMASLYYMPPVLRALSSATGSAGTSVTISGNGLASARSVSFGAVSTTSFTPDPLNPDGKLSVVVPEGVLGTVDVKVNSAGGTSAVVPAGRFTVTTPAGQATTSPTTAPAGSSSVAGSSLASISEQVLATGYRLVSADGGIFAFGGAEFLGSTGGMRLNSPIVSSASTPSGKGYWLVGADGGVFAFGDAKFFGSTAGLKLNKSIVGMAPTPSGKGYWLVASDGGIFAFGDAAFYGSTGAMPLNQPIVAINATPTGKGYWLVASDGGIFAFGNATFQGSTGALKLNKPIVGMASSPTGTGYWLVASDGGIFAFGDAMFQGSTGAMKLNQPIVAVVASGNGYRLVASDGGIFAFGDASFAGSAGGIRLNQPIVAATWG